MINEKNIQMIFDEITSPDNDNLEETMEKTASEEDFVDVDELITSLKKTASVLDTGKEDIDDEEEYVEEEEVEEEEGDDEVEEDDDDDDDEKIVEEIAKEKNANEEDIEKFDSEGIGGELMLSSDNSAKQRLKEIAFNGLKNGEQSSGKYAKLRKRLLEKKASVDLIEELSDRLVESILSSENKI